MKQNFSIIGKEFGRLTVVRSGGKENGHALFVCRCRCGKNKVVRGHALIYGLVKSCGCLRSELAHKRHHAVRRYDAKSLVGKKFGRLTVLRCIRTKSPRDTYPVTSLVCRCDCGKIATSRKYHVISGRAKSCGCLMEEARSRRGKDNPNWKGGHVTSQGYRVFSMRDHPNARKSGYIFEHVHVMSEVLGRALGVGETVHHKNGIRSDNRKSNLELWSSSHPPGQRIQDKVKWCLDFLDKYKPEALWRKGRKG